MCKGCEIRTRLMVGASAELDTILAFATDALANGHDDGHAGALSELLPRLSGVAVQLAGPAKRTPRPPRETRAPLVVEPAPQPQEFTHAARVAAAMER